MAPDPIFLLLCFLAGLNCCVATFDLRAPPVDCAHHLSSCSSSTPVCVRSPSVLATLLLPTSEFLGTYLEGAIKLGFSATQNSDAGLFDLVLLQLEDQPLSESWQKPLIGAGWQICTVKPIKPPEPGLVFPRFRDQFAKLHLWSFVEYRRVVYMDSDCLVVGNINSLFNDDNATNLTSTSFAAPHDYWDGKWKPGFNMGVFVLAPSTTEYHRLLSLLKESKAMDYPKWLAEQGFLNYVYKNQWTELEPQYAASTAIYLGHPDVWAQFDLRVIHYTVVKPWRCKNPFALLCSLWKRFKKRRKP